MAINLKIWVNEKQWHNRPPKEGNAKELNVLGTEADQKGKKLYRTYTCYTATFTRSTLRKCYQILARRQQEFTAVYELTSYHNETYCFPSIAIINVFTC